MILGHFGPKKVDFGHFSAMLSHFQPLSNIFVTFFQNHPVQPTVSAIVNITSAASIVTGATMGIGTFRRLASKRPTSPVVNSASVASTLWTTIVTKTRVSVAAR